MSLAVRLPGERRLPTQDADRIAEIRAQLIAIGDAWRLRHPWLAAHQDAIGMTFFLLAVAGVALDGVLTVVGVMPWWVCVPATAFWLSLLHELEHDLIHRMYFRSRPRVQDAMMLGVWVLRPSTINPWLRRELHLHHHKVSGTESDIEERTLSNGDRWNGFRLLLLADSLIGLYVRPWRIRAIIRDYVDEVADTPEERRAIVRRLRLHAYLPLGVVHYGLWHAFLAVHVLGWVGVPVGPGGWYHALDVAAVVLLAPNALRTFCLHFVSSNMHYHGDVEQGNVLQQTQVWTSKWLWPLHAFCCNFGGTHAIHHFLVRDPFYVREATGGRSRAVLRAGGVRFDDYQTFRRANRFGLPGALTPVATE